MNEMNELYTIRDVIRWTVSRFNEAGLCYGHGTETAWDEAVALILHTLHLPPDINPGVLDARLTSSERELISKKIHKRISERIPVPYITNEAWFAGLSFYVDERVLIPRSPIAELIEKSFEPFVEMDNVIQILDLCTGSGCIAIACAKAFPGALIDATDISPDALAVAKQNVLRHHVEDQVNLYEANLFDGLPTKKYDLIISNPPYVTEGEMQTLPNEYHHEPALGLRAGDDGLDVVIKILQQSLDYLTPDGTLIVEVGNSEYYLTEKFPEIPFTWLDFQMGGDGGGVFLLSAKDIKKFQADFK